MFIFNESLNFISGLGIVALIGIAVNDAIVFIDTYLKMRRENPELTRARALADSGSLRFKPILSTTTTTILGITPLAIDDPFWRGLGVSLIFGLMFSTLGTLFIVPLIENFVATIWTKIRNIFRRKRASRS